MTAVKHWLEQRQISLYFMAVMAGIVTGQWLEEASKLETAINPTLALMLLVTFLQVPIAELRLAFKQRRFLGALLFINFAVIPLLVAGLAMLLPPNPMIRLGVLLVLLAPCIDYVVTFSHLGRADARLLLAATPVLLLMQMLLLPLYLHILLGEDMSYWWQPQAFIQTFIGLIVIPLLLAALLQKWGQRYLFSRVLLRTGEILPVPATALVLWIVVTALMPKLGAAMDLVLPVIPVYLLFAVLAPMLGWGMGRLMQLDLPACRALAFSAATRNSLVLLPLVFAVPGAIPVLPAVIIMQTLVELCCELVYIRLLPRLGSKRG